MTTSSLRAVFVVVLLLLAACGEPAATPPPATPGAATSGAADAVSAALRVSITGGPTPTVFGLTCGEAPRWTEGDPGRDARAACATVAAERDRLLALSGPPPTDRMCTEIYGGPEVAAIEGEIDGQAVDARVTRSDGCGISDWDALEPLLGPPSAMAAEPVR